MESEKLYESINMSQYMKDRDYNIVDLFIDLQLSNNQIEWLNDNLKSNWKYSTNNKNKKILQITTTETIALVKPATGKRSYKEYTYIISIHQLEDNYYYMNYGGNGNFIIDSFDGIKQFVEDKELQKHF